MKMINKLRGIERVSCIIKVLSLSIVLTIVSFAIQRHGPEVGVYGNVCGPNGDQLCLRPKLNAGFPLGYVFDNTATSVRDQLTPFVEDDFRIFPFLLDLLIYGTGIYLISLGLKKIRIREPTL
jgi:hypothetical protein